jgi:pimeloyl-ACP methyl ester carboxylesterase
VTGRERILELPHVRIAAREWGPEDGRPVLALHGWLDNSASFDRLAPMLSELRLVAVDLTGHGRSQHRPAAQSHYFVDWVPEVAAVADALDWERFSLIGHSMGAGISSLVPAVYPDRVEAAVLIEGAGPFAADAETAPAQMISALADEARLEGSSPRVFPTRETAVIARMRDTDLDRESATVLVERGTEEVEGGVRFTHDPRLRTRSRLRLTENQTLAFLCSIGCPVLAVRALQGWPFPEEVFNRRMAAIPDLQLVEVEGGHHVHLTHPERVAPAINEFFGR